METLFEDLYTLKRDKMHLVAHHIKKLMKVWWKGVKRDRSLDFSLVTWEDFRGLVFSAYFSDGEKKKLQESSGSCGKETARRGNIRENSLTL